MLKISFMPMPDLAKAWIKDIINRLELLAISYASNGQIECAGQCRVVIEKCRQLQVLIESEK